jgi:hypothetical protein
MGRVSIVLYSHSVFHLIPPLTMVVALIREATPSFALMDIQGPVVVTYVYQLVDGEVKVDKVEYRKPDSAGAASTTTPGGGTTGAGGMSGASDSAAGAASRTAGW